MTTLTLIDHAAENFLAQHAKPPRFVVLTKNLYHALRAEANHDTPTDSPLTTIQEINSTAGTLTVVVPGINAVALNAATSGAARSRAPNHPTV